MNKLFLFLLYVSIIIIIGFVIYLTSKKRGVIYDERQKIAQSNSYKYAFYTLIAFELIYVSITMINDREYLSTYMLVFIGFCLSALVFGSYQIIKDAYVAPKDSFNQAGIILGIISVMNLVLGITNLSQTKIENGIITYVSPNLMLGITLLLIFLVYIVKKIQISHEEKEI